MAVAKYEFGSQFALLCQISEKIENKCAEKNGFLIIFDNLCNSWTVKQFERSTKAEIKGRKRKKGKNII